MGDLSKHFNRSEFACRCGCGFDTVDSELIKILEEVRDYFATPVRITSGCRCHEYNEKIGGAYKSQHKLGRAADIVLTVEPDVVADYLAVMDVGGVGRYSTFSHVDSRTTDRPARWKG
jgi:uncharacterized protein YcbK (DUF882 family)